MSRKDNQHSLMFTISFLFFCFVLVPVIFVYQGAEFLETRIAQQQRQNIIANISSAIRSLRSNVPFEGYYLALLNDAFDNTDNPEHFTTTLGEVLSAQNVSYDLLRWHRHQLVDSTFCLPQSASQLNSWHDFSRNLYSFYDSSELNDKESAYRELLPVLGPHFFLQTFKMRKQAITFNELRQLSGEDGAPLVWFGETDEGLFVVRLYPDSFCRKTSLSHYISGISSLPSQYAFIEKAKVIFGSYSDAQALSAAVHRFDRFADLDYFVDEGFLYYRVQLSIDNMIVFIVPLESPGLGSAFMARFIFLILTAFFAWFVKSELLVSGLRNMSIIRQTLVFTMISAGIPTLVLFFSGASYFAQRQELLIKQKSQQMSEYLETIDRQSSTYLAYVSNILESSISVFALDSSKPEELSKKIRQYLDRIFGRNLYDDVLYLFMNRTLVISGKIYLDFGLSDKRPEGFATGKQRKEARMWWWLLKEYLYMLNGMSGQSGLPEDVALFFEAGFQKSYQLLLGFFLDMDGQLTQTGFGSTQTYLYIKAEDQTDYDGVDSIVMGSFSEMAVAQGYLRRVIDSLQRNPYGLRIYALSGAKVLPSDSLDDCSQQMFAALCSNAMHAQPQIVDYNDEQWLFCGVNSKSMYNSDLVALFPLNDILSQVHDERRDLVVMGGIALALVLMLVLIFNFNLVFPLRQLNLAAEALEHRNFDFRVATLPDDELGEMGRIFNRSIEDFEELHIASAVQSRLFPQKAISFENISLFAQTVPMVELGGDYNDYFVVDSQRVAMLLGDVAGHGVGASLIMAMAKAGIMCAKDVHDDPAQVLVLLHKLVVASKNKRQRKIMTFQYACFNHATGEGVYANAGGCHPLIINPQSGTVRELASIGSPLGAFKKAKYGNLSFKLEPGEAIVFYTDGIIESRNLAGEEIGYDRFMKLLIEHYHSDAEQYYCGVYGAYVKWIQGLDAQDDVSLVILVRNNTLT